MKKPEATKSWQRALAARAMGQQPDPEDLAAAREAARPSVPGWAEKLAERAVEQRQARGGRTFAEALRERLRTSQGTEGEPPPKPPAAA